jgi:hypothetical protein
LNDHNVVSPIGRFVPGASRKARRWWLGVDRVHLFLSVMISRIEMEHIRIPMSLEKTLEPEVASDLVF